MRTSYREAGRETWTDATVVSTKTNVWRLAAIDAFLPMARLVRERTHVDNDRLPFSESNRTSRRWVLSSECKETLWLRRGE
jgi:hypothetical protein